MDEEVERLPHSRTGSDIETSRLARPHPAQRQCQQRHLLFTKEAQPPGSATPRARVEQVFVALAQMGGKLMRCMASVRVTFSLHLKAASYNLKRLVFLKEGCLVPFSTEKRAWAVIYRRLGPNTPFPLLYQVGVRDQ